MNRQLQARLARALGLAAAVGGGCHTTGLPTPPPVAAARPAAPAPRVALTRSAHDPSRAAPEPPGAVRGLPARLAEAAFAEAFPAAAAAVVPAALAAPAEAPAEVPPAAGSLIDLGLALRLAGVDNPTINLARAVVSEAAADELAARVLLLPSVNVGGNVRLHRGVYQRSNGEVFDAAVQSVYAGAGAGAVGGGSPNRPGVWLFAHLGDAAYEPLAARQRLTARRADAAAVRNGVLADVAAAYLTLAGAEARVRVLREGETKLAEVVRLTAAFARTGQGREADANRAAVNADLLRRDVLRAEEEVAAAAARLAALLNLDPGVPLRTPGGDVTRICLIPDDVDLESLVGGALRSRPEVSAGSARVGEAQTRVKQERVRPWLPTLSVGYSAALFGGGGRDAPRDFSSLDGRSDLDVVAVWNLRNLGFGNRAGVRGAGAGVGAAVADYEQTVNRVRREVADAAAEVKAAAAQYQTAAAGLAAADEGFRLEDERIRRGQGLPLEVLDSFRQWLELHQEVIRAAVAYDVAQFRLWAAVGNDPGAAGPGVVGP